MRKHSLGRRPDDEPGTSVYNPPTSSNAGPTTAKGVGRHGFTSAKYDDSRSDILDRRKADKSPLLEQTEDDAADMWRETTPEEQNAKRKLPSLAALPAGVPAKGSTNPAGRGPGRGQSPWRSSILVLATTLCSTLLLFAIVSSFFTRHVDPKGCKMCGMWPAYAKLDGFDTEHTRFASKYSLYLYREAVISEDTTVRGVPVLFITGNAGSYRQVRPLAAEAAHYFAEHLQNDAAAQERGTRDLDFFTADFNEDITAFHGQTLLDQAEYLNEAIAYILSLYHDPERPRRAPGEPDPTSVIVIGHSMGGVVARTMLLMPNYQSNSINTIITMSTPHARPPVSFDADIVRAYKDVNDHWRRSYSQKWASDNPLWHVTLISIAGGGLDITVPSDYADLSSVVPESHGFTVFTSSIPDVWTGSDHLSILWCDQLRKVIVRAILDIVDVGRASQTKSRAQRMRVFRRWLLPGMEQSTEKTLSQGQPSTVLTLEDDSNSILRENERLVVRQLGGSDRPKAFLMPLPPSREPEKLEFQLLSDQTLRDQDDSAGIEVLMCSVFPLNPGHSGAIFSMNMDLTGSSSGATRLACKGVGRDVVHLPASTASSSRPFDDASPFSYLRYELGDLAEYQYVAVFDRNPSPRPGWVVAEFAPKTALYQSVPSGLSEILSSGVSTTLPATRPLAVEIQLPALHSSLLVYKLRLGNQACGEDTQLFTPLLRQHVSHPFESKYFVNAKEADINLHADAPFMPPPLKISEDPPGLSLQIWSDPTCGSSLDVSLRIDVMGSLGKLVMRYRTVFPAIPLVIIVLVLRKQFMMHDQTGLFMTFSEALDLCLRTSLPTLLLALTVFSLSIASSNPHASGLPTGGVFPAVNSTQLAYFGRNDLLLGSQEPFFRFLIPVFGFIGVGICVWINYASLLLVRILSFATGVTGLFSRSRKSHRRRASLVPVTTSSLRRRLTITFILLAMVSTIIPYQFAYMVACIVQLATCVRAVTGTGDMTPQAHDNFYNYAHSLLVLMLCVLPINIPVFVVWVHNLAVHWLTPFSSHHNVLSIMPFIVLVETLTAGTVIPRVTSRFRHVTNILFFFLAVYAGLYGVSFAYRLHHLANLICAWLVAVHFSTSASSWTRLGQLLGGTDTSEGEKLKKRP